MPRILSVVLIAATFGLIGATSAGAQALSIGGELPMADRSMTSATGGATSFGQAIGQQGLAVVFWSNTCPWTRRYEQRLVDLAREYGGSGIGFVVVNPNDPVGNPGDNLDAMRQRASEGGYEFPYVVDEGSAAARAFGATRTPQVFVFDGNRRLVYEGGLDNSPSDAAGATHHYFRDALTSLRDGGAVTVDRTSAFGCTIKFAN